MRKKNWSNRKFLPGKENPMRKKLKLKFKLKLTSRIFEGSHPPLLEGLVWTKVYFHRIYLFNYDMFD